jgi:large subunit ribosomal protein L23
MILKPVLTEKSLNEAKRGSYTFRVDRRMNKGQIRKAIEEVFGVHVIKIRTISERGEAKRTWMGKSKVIKPSKKAIVRLKEKEKIDLFETKGK